MFSDNVIKGWYDVRNYIFYHCLYMQNKRGLPAFSGEFEDVADATINREYLFDTLDFVSLGFRAGSPEHSLIAWFAQRAASETETSFWIENNLLFPTTSSSTEYVLNSLSLLFGDCPVGADENCNNTEE